MAFYPISVCFQSELLRFFITGKFQSRLVWVFTGVAQNNRHPQGDEHFDEFSFLKICF